MTCQIHRAGWVVIDPWTILQNGFIEVEAGRIKAVGTGNRHAMSRLTDHGEGVLLPAPVNVHTHLELCALQGRVPFEYGFQQWVRELLRQREAIGTDALKSGAMQGIKELKESGCCAAGEISTLGITREIFSESGLAGVWFREFLGTGTVPEEFEALQEFEYVSAAGHAPHTTSPELLVTLKKITRNYRRPFSIHLAESEDETAFLTTGKGAWADFLTERGIDFSGWGLPVKSPVHYMERLGILDEKTIAVHLIHTEPDDFEILHRRNVHLCLCFRSNQNLHQRLPDMEGMLQAGLKLCLGTDSLASADSLDIFDEMAFISCNCKNIPPEEIFAMATVNGARALGLSDRFGSLSPGKYPAFHYLPVKVSSRKRLSEAVVHYRVCRAD